MAVSVDSVYQTVLTLLNKEQRGYLPQKEFNQLAQNAQVAIFENYFFELGRATAQYGEMSNEYSSIADNIFEKLEDFELVADATPDGSGGFDLNSLPSPGLYRLQTITSNQIEVMRKKHREIGYMLRSPLTSPVASMPLYIRQGNNLTFYPNPTTQDLDPNDATDTANLTNVRINYIRNLSTQPRWNGMVMNGQIVVIPTTNTIPDPANPGQMIPDPDRSINFELHPSEEPELVAKILGYAGVAVKAADVQQAATGLQTQIDNSEQ